MSDDESKEDVADPPAPAEAQPAAGEAAANGSSNRRRFFELASLVLGGLVGLVPALIGLFAFLDPLFRKTTKPALHREDAGGAGEGFIRVASVEALSPDVPQRFPVIADQIDAWNFTPDQPIGAVYIEQPTSGELRVFNTTCPHAGCSVSCNGSSYECPCHNSAFNLDGSKRSSKAGRANPSPRALDSLNYQVIDGQIWVEFKNFYTGKEEKKEKA